MTSTKKPADGFTAEERAAIKERADEVKPRRGTKAKVDDTAAVLEKIAGMPGPDRLLAERIHAIVAANAPDLKAKLWYGMPAYARASKIICFFQAADKFKVRYATLGFNQDAQLDDGTMWPTAYALTELTAADAARIGELIKKAAG